MAMRILAAVVAVAAGGGIAAPALAKITQYECRFDQSRARGGGWVPEILVVTDNDATGEVLAFDPVIRHFVGKPIPARRSSQTRVRVTYLWDLEIRNKGQSARLTYTLSYFSNGLPAKLRVQPGAYDNTWSGEGRCTVAAK